MELLKNNSPIHNDEIFKFLIHTKLKTIKIEHKQLNIYNYTLHKHTPICKHECKHTHACIYKYT